MRYVAVLVALFLTSVHAQGSSNRTRLAWVDRTGRVLGTISPGQWNLLYPSVSPDATKIAVRGEEVENAPPRVYLFDVPRGTSRRLTNESVNEGQPAWSPKGDRIAYLSYRNGLGDIYIKPASGGEEQRVTVDAELHDFAP